MDGCQACGEDGPQVDDEVDRRRALAAEVRSLLDVVPVGDPIDLLEIWGELSGWIEQLYDALEKVGQKLPDGADALAAALSSLARLRGSAAVTPRRRPLSNLYGQLDRILDGLDGLARADLDALEAQSPSQAQAQQRRAQLLLDGAAERAAECSRILERLGIEVEGSFFDAMARDTEHAFNLAGAESLLDFEARGAQVYERITGGLKCPVGMGFSLMLLDSKLSDGFDRDRFYQDVPKAYRAYVDQPSRLDLLIADEDWRKRVRRAGRELFSAAVEAFDQASGSIKDQWFETRTMLRLSLLLTEGVAPIYLATLLALQRKDDWRRHRDRDPGQLLQEVASAGYGELVIGLDVGVRDADAHRAYLQLHDGIALTARARVGNREISAEELLDLTLAAVESCLLLQTALSCAMTARGIAAEDLDAASDLVPKVEQIRVMASAAGLRNVAVQHIGDTVRISATGTMEPTQLLSTSAGIASIEIANAERLEYELADANGAVSRATGPLEPLRRVGRTDGILKECATVEVAALWRIGSAPVFNEAYVRHWAAIRLGQTLDDLRGTLACVDAVTNLASAVGDKQLRKTAEAFGRLTRARMAGLQPPKKDRWASEQVVRWLNDNEPPPHGMAPA